jgi:hypothetical protein
MWQLHNHLLLISTLTAAFFVILLLSPIQQTGVEAMLGGRQKNRLKRPSTNVDVVRRSSDDDDGGLLSDRTVDANDDGLLLLETDPNTRLAEYIRLYFCWSLSVFD